MDRPVTLVLGASPEAWRYANMAVGRLVAHGHIVLAVGKREGAIGHVPITREVPEAAHVDTITLYLNRANQAAWHQRILGLRPRRIIFNPGAENPDLARDAAAQGVEVVEGCTLVMLAAGTY